MFKKHYVCLEAHKHVLKSINTSICMILIYIYKIKIDVVSERKKIGIEDEN